MSQLCASPLISLEAFRFIMRECPNILFQLTECSEDNFEIGHIFDRRHFFIILMYQQHTCVTARSCILLVVSNLVNWMISVNSNFRIIRTGSVVPSQGFFFNGSECSLIRTPTAVLRLIQTRFGTKCQFPCPPQLEHTHTHTHKGRIQASKLQSRVPLFRSRGRIWQQCSRQAPF